MMTNRIEYEYLSDDCYSVEDLEEVLQDHGKLGWRLHTVFSYVDEEKKRWYHATLERVKYVENDYNEEEGAMPMKG